MSRSLKLGDEEHVVFMGIGLYLKNLGFGIETPIGPSIGILALFSLACYRFELFIAFEWNAPSLVISKMPMKAVEVKE
ncbi:hypothetical protein SDC9_89901 [bioreactor metagenome]|uniref:Uncharacterized protein n=1 Tax=bioreactor metagenome TaxID=1076179 RepID=A0A644ZS58_9ZZZZ